MARDDDDLAKTFDFPEVDEAVPAAPTPAEPSAAPPANPAASAGLLADSVKIRKGRVHTLSRPTPMVSRSGGTEVVCTLPPGTSIYAAKSTRTNVKGAWLPVFGTAVTLPE